MFANQPRGPRRAILVGVAVVALIVGLWLGGHPSWLPAPVRSAFVQTNGNDQILLATHDGMAIRFEESDVRDMGRPAAGVSGADLAKDDEVMDLVIIPRTRSVDVNPNSPNVATTVVM